jgi:hypothetical protein
MKPCNENSLHCYPSSHQSFGNSTHNCNPTNQQQHPLLAQHNMNQTNNLSGVQNVQKLVQSINSQFSKIFINTGISKIIKKKLLMIINS